MRKRPHSIMCSHRSTIRIQSLGNCWPTAKTITIRMLMTRLARVRVHVWVARAVPIMNSLSILAIIPPTF